ncbi:hypothetical protein Leryth_021093 [Lithospermum erythrorhizon]|nr:hypothetical protein Leryth_021093 [Lithospermum erythrorhizon]
MPPPLPLLLLLFFLLSTSTTTTSLEDDIKCLQGIKSTMSDPQNKLSTWSFSPSSSSSVSICSMFGVSCWNEKENRLISLSLTSSSLSGQLPTSLSFCNSLQTLDFSRNDFSGQIPPQICDWLPYLVTLDLSYNSFSGSIPTQIGKCRFLNTLKLERNHFSGTLPPDLGRLDRLKRFSVADNSLSGVVPDGLERFSKDSFLGNGELCGGVLGLKCEGLSRKSLVVIVVAGVLGALGSLVIGFGVWWWFRRRWGRFGKGGKGEGGDSWIEKLRACKLVQVTLFQKPINKIKVNDLLVATSGFDYGNVVVSSRTGVSYRAVLQDGSALMVKRLSSCKMSDKQFRSEMNRLGQLRHPNLVPLLGFCMVEDERLLVYKHMENGSLYSLLHSKGSNGERSCLLDWKARLKVCLGAARGIAWLHHGCLPPYIHQYVSSNVILVDEDYDARIMDYGLAKIVSSIDSHGVSFDHSDLGELGYVAPEYTNLMEASAKADVYSFGVVLLELVTGRKPYGSSNVDEGFKGNLVDWVTQFISSGQTKDAIDKVLCGKAYDNEILQVLKIACSCVASRPKDRPIMYNVYQSLKTIGIGHGFSGNFDEFPMKFGIQDHNRKD